MESIASMERNRLRYAGRIPQETLDYLAMKREQDLRFSNWIIPAVLVICLFAASIPLTRFVIHHHEPTLRDYSTFLIYFVSIRLLQKNQSRRKARA